MRVAARITLLLMLAAQAARAEPWGDPEKGGYTRSIGLPQQWRVTAGAGVGAETGPSFDGLVSELRFGWQADLLHPVMALLALRVEGNVALRGTDAGAGARALLVSPSLRLGAGVSWSTFDHDFRPVVTANFAVRRGGLFGSGTTLRFDWLPRAGGQHAFLVGVEVPLLRLTEPGASRPERDHVPLFVPRPKKTREREVSAALVEAVENLRDDALWVQQLVLPPIGQTGATRAGATDSVVESLRSLRLQLATRDVAETMEAWHRDIDHAFTLALGDATVGTRAADEARRVLLDEVLLPYDRLFGQTKVPDTLAPFTAAAEGLFARWLLIESGLPKKGLAEASWVFGRVVEAIEHVRARTAREWENSRYVWLALQLALQPHEHDSQAEFDALVERALAEPFTRGNRVWYLANEQFRRELHRGLHAARDYHVLWIHDFRGKNDEGTLDEAGFRTMIDGYYGAMTARLLEYDRTGTLPVFMVFIDQWFFEATEGKQWLSILADPLRRSARLPSGYEAWERELGDAQRRLQEAVRGSVLLNREIAEQGPDWLWNRIKVHVNVTNPADDTFWSNEVLPLLGIPDNMMRDHRKIAFYDVTERDPWQGEAVLTGMGIGETYSGPEWQDRAIVARGPVNLELKDAARRLLMAQGFREEQIPWPLRPHPLPHDFLAQVAEHAGKPAAASAIQLHNDTGYGDKRVNVAKAVVYTLMPAGSVTIVPDSLWNAPSWGSMLLGQALRGGRVLVMAPVPENAPSAGFPQLSRAEELLGRLVLAGQMLAEPLEKSGGMLRVGLYRSKDAVTDLPARLRAGLEGFRRYPFLLDLLGFHPSVLDVIARVAEEQEPAFAPLRTDGEPPKLHLKVNFTASREMWRLLSHPAWAPVLATGLEYRASQLLRPDEDASPTNMPAELARQLDELEKTLRASISEEDRARLIAYMLVGSHNQNERSLVMDGEVVFLVSGGQVGNAVIDLALLAPECEWPRTLEELEPLLPPAGGLKRLIGQWIRTAL